MLFALGFLCAALLALAAVPALSRRADRLARKRAEAAFPLSLAEIAADRDHLRAELAVKMRSAEQEAEKGFAARAGAMQEIGRRDMDIGQLQHARPPPARPSLSQARPRCRRGVAPCLPACRRVRPACRPAP